jgi:hypothetical protein
MNMLLDAPFTAEEVMMALFMMNPNKAPGLDGFITCFYQCHWKLISTGVCGGVHLSK